jgi:OOP family OmpA-OmpF porin
MKLLISSLAFALSGLLLLSPAALAGQREGAFTLSPLVGYHVFEGDQKTDDAASYGLAFGYNITKNWAVELDARYTPTETDFDGGDNFDIDVWTGSLNALYHFNPDGPFVPYLAAGFGGMVFDADEGPEVTDGRDDDEDFMLNAGAGFKYFLNEDFALRVDARYVADLHSDRNYDQGSSDDIDNNLIATAGLVWQFGGPPPAPAPPADSDMDGVPDSRDKCPGTPSGVAVDAVGCPPAPPKPPAPEVKPVPVPPPPDPCASAGDLDGDGVPGDGVPNCRDKCPGTEKGIIVDESGCPVKFTLNIEFDFDKAQVRPEYHAKLKEAADFIKKYPDTKFLLAGHTDSKGTDKYNKTLSERRAAAVKKYLVENFGIAAHTLYPRGYGESRPIADNATDEGRQKNRRVEVICCIIIPEE